MFHNCFGEVTSGEIVFWKRRRWRMQNRRNMASHENIIIAFYIFSTLSPSNTQMWRWEQFQGRIGGSFEGSHSTMSHMRDASHSSLKTLLRIKSKLVIRELALRFKCKFRGKTFTESCLSLFSENFKEPKGRVSHLFSSFIIMGPNPNYTWPFLLTGPTRPTWSTYLTYLPDQPNDLFWIFSIFFAQRENMRYPPFKYNKLVIRELSIRFTFMLVRTRTVTFPGLSNFYHIWPQ